MSDERSARARLPAGDVLPIAVALLAALSILEIDVVSDVALAVLAVTFVAWPIGLILYLMRRWAAMSDWRFVGLAGLLIVTAVGSALGGILLGR